MINITVIGFGNVGSVLSVMLLNAIQDIRLNIMDPDPTLEGAFLDLNHGMPLFRSAELHINDPDLFEEADFVFYTAGTPNKHGGSRLSTAKKNIELTKEIFESVRFKKEPYVIVITNPVDIVAHSVYQFSGLSSERVIGTGTLLESVRLSYYLAELTGYSMNHFNAMVLGEHGDSQVPIYSHTTLNGKLISEFPKFDQELLDKAKELTRTAAFQIRETQTGTTYGVAKCALKIMQDLTGNEQHNYPLSVLTNDHYMDLLRIDHPIFISMPVSVSNNCISVRNLNDFTEEELDAYRRSAVVLSDIIL